MTGVPATSINGLDPDRFTYSFCTMVTNIIEYQAMLIDFKAKGFDETSCEFMFIDNSVEPKFDAYEGYNIFLARAQATYIVLCHQDIVPLADDRSRLDQCLKELTELDVHWGLCGNAGYNHRGEPIFRITDPRGEQSFGAPWPAPVISLDENFIVVRRAANLALSRDLSGFHWYGSDLCIIAEILGWRAYVIDFHLRHNSGGNPNDSFTRTGRDLQQKYRRAFRSRWQYVTTDRPLYISSSHMLSSAAQLYRRIYNALNETYHSLRRKVKKTLI